MTDSLGEFDLWVVCPFFLEGGRLTIGARLFYSLSRHFDLHRVVESRPRDPCDRALTAQMMSTT